MVARVLRLLLIRSLGPGGATAFLAATAVARRVTKQREAVLTQRLGPGEQLVVEHLAISHKRQLKQLKREEQQARRAARTARKARRGTAS